MCILCTMPSGRTQGPHLKADLKADLHLKADTHTSVFSASNSEQNTENFRHFHSFLEILRIVYSPVYGHFRCPKWTGGIVFLSSSGGHFSPLLLCSIKGTRKNRSGGRHPLSWWLKENGSVWTRSAKPWIHQASIGHLRVGSHWGVV